MESRSFEVIPHGSVTSPKGFMAGSVYAGIKSPKPEARDVAILASTAPCVAAGLFTTNKVRSAPVIVSEGNLVDSKAQAVVVNSGRANACTGEQGLEDAREMAALTASKLGMAPEDVLVASTGVIGVLMPMDNLRSGIEQVLLSAAGGPDFARAIITTDTRTKEIAIWVKLDDIVVTIGGAAKGAGMIHPNMATMLAFVTTDAAVEPEFLKKALRRAADLSFNMITVDLDTSTSDSLFLLANGQAGNPSTMLAIDHLSPHAAIFESALTYVCTYLAKEIARDGEGATKLIEVNVEGALSEGDARMMARTIASSSLLKAALHGNDPNWGRIVAAAGRSGAEMLEARTDVYIGELQLMQAGRPLPFDKKIASRSLDKLEVFIRVVLNIGSFGATAWGCDLSEEYVRINSEYTT
ncbi:MAG: bifunctional glutamate N-acetyltransferase/amino-acid acetyltransferase ArgJ [Dehalococcoidia bacterium]|nr:bifunctional glutamate N-acetyltransferase/amino-acid acetyltransferase ArgJ [Dehalococcoidia bacterium]